MTMTLTLSFSFSLISLSQILPLVGLIGLDDCKWVWVWWWLGLVETVGWGRGLKIGIEDWGWGQDWGLRLRWGSGLLGWWVLWRFCSGFSLRFVSWVFFFFWVVGGWGCGWWWWLWLWPWPWFISDELEKLKPWRFWEQIAEGGRSFTGVRKMER